MSAGSVAALRWNARIFARPSQDVRCRHPGGDAAKRRGPADGECRLHGGRWRSRLSPPRSYILTGRGHEELDLHRTDLYQNGPIHERTDMFGRAFGNLRIVRRPNEPAEAGALLLRLLPRGSFTLGLSPLRGGTTACASTSSS